MQAYEASFVFSPRITNHVHSYRAHNSYSCIDRPKLRRLPTCSSSRSAARLFDFSSLLSSSPYRLLFFPTYDETPRVNQPQNTTGPPFIADFPTLAEELLGSHVRATQLLFYL
jgi:hypothetical protein